MRSVLTVVVGLSISGLVLAGQQTVFRSGARTVALYVTATDAQKRLVADLAQADFEILDNGKPVPITLFDNEVQPISVVVMLDTSASMTLSLDILKAGAEQFVIRLLPVDKAKVGAFNDKIQVLPRGEFIGDRDELRAIIKNDLQYGNPTRLYDAIDASLEALTGQEGRRVVLVFTDGDDTYSKLGRGEVQRRALADEVMVYAIGLETNFFNGQMHVRTKPDRGLKSLAEETGGGYFELKETSDLGPTFTRVAQELHSQYLMGFTPDVMDGKTHKLVVRVKQLGVTARARKTYVASAGAPK
jgi:Ca-activated chloride channel homolog